MVKHEIRSVGDTWYKVISKTPKKVVCYKRRGSKGRWSSKTVTFTTEQFETFNIISTPSIPIKTLNNSVKIDNADLISKSLTFESASAVNWTEDVANSDNIKILAKANNELRKQLQSQKSGEKLIHDTLTDFLKSKSFKVEIPKTPVFKNSNLEKEIPALHISDTQIGKITKTYDKTVAEKRLISLINKTLKIVNMRRTIAFIDEIRVYLGGDIVEGEEIFAHQAHEIEESVYDQAMYTAPMILAKCILMLLKDFKKVKVVCVPGNHGRNGSRNTRSHPRTNWDNVCYRTTKLLLLGEKSELLNRLEWVDNESWYAVDHIFDWGNLIVHGDQIRGGLNGFPWYGAARKAWGWVDSVSEPWDYLWFGHFHTYAGPVTLNKRIFLANGTTESDNEYARAELASSGHPCQRLTFFNADHGLIADHQIFLENRIPSKVHALTWFKTSDNVNFRHNKVFKETMSMMHV